jgi:hypothetical protein
MSLIPQTYNPLKGRLEELVSNTKYINRNVVIRLPGLQHVHCVFLVYMKDIENIRVLKMLCSQGSIIHLC